MDEETGKWSLGRVWTARRTLLRCRVYGDLDLQAFLLSEAGERHLYLWRNPVYGVFCYHIPMNQDVVLLLLWPLGFCWPTLTTWKGCVHVLTWLIIFCQPHLGSVWHPTLPWVLTLVIFTASIFLQGWAVHFCITSLLNSGRGTVQQRDLSCEWSATFKGLILCWLG